MVTLVCTIAKPCDYSSINQAVEGQMTKYLSASECLIEVTKHVPQYVFLTSRLQASYCFACEQSFMLPFSATSHPYTLIATLWFSFSLKQHLANNVIQLTIKIPRRLRDKVWPEPSPPVASFEGQRVFVTGATAGLGLAAAVHFATMGARVIMTSRSLCQGKSASDHVEQRAGVVGKGKTCL